MMERSERPAPEDRDLLRGQERPLIKATQDLARVIAEVEPNPDYAVQAPAAVIVGGFVRDMLLGLHPKDADVEVYGVAPEQLKALLEKLFGKTKDVGEAFGIIKIPIGNGLELDVSIPRRESKVGKGHTGFLVDSDPSLDIKEAARRRDFTVNAMAMDPITATVFDPFDGLKDLETRTLRVTDPERFQDDPLRVLRAMQFMARLDFSIDEKSEELMHEMVARGDLSELSRERITEEFEKLLFKGRRPSTGLRFAEKNGILEAVFPDVKVTNWDLWEERIDAMVEVGKTRHAMLAMFFSGFTPETRSRIAASLTIKKKDVEAALAIVTEAERGEGIPTNPVNDARKKIKRILPAEPVSYAAFLRALKKDQEAEEFLQRIEQNELTAQPLLQGRDLIEKFGMKPGPNFRQLLESVEAKRDSGEISTFDEAIALVKTLV